MSSVSSQVSLIVLEKTKNAVMDNNPELEKDKVSPLGNGVKVENEKKKIKKAKKSRFPINFLRARKRRKIETETNANSLTHSDQFSSTSSIKSEQKMMNHKNKANYLSKEDLSRDQTDLSSKIITIQSSFVTGNENVTKEEDIKNIVEAKEKAIKKNVDHIKENGNVPNFDQSSNKKTKSPHPVTLFFKKIFFKQDGEEKATKTKCIENYAFFSVLFPALMLYPAILHKDINKNDHLYKISRKFKIKLAASHIDDAIYGRGMFGKARACRQPLHAQRCFAVVSSRYWMWLIYLTIAVHALIIIWEQPAPLYLGQPWPTNDGSVWHVPWVVLAVNSACLIVYFIDIFLHTVFMGFRNFWTSKESLNLRVEAIFAIFFLIDQIILICQSVLRMRLLSPFRCLRVAMLLCKSRNVAHIFNVLRSIFRKLGKVFGKPLVAILRVDVIVIIIIFILVFASIGLQIFMDIYHEVPMECCNSTTTWNCSSIYSGAFDNIGIASLHMFVLMSTENYPEVIIPAFDTSWGYFFFFGIFLYAGVFFLTAILLAIIVESYWEYSKKHVKDERKQERGELAKAWNLLDPAGTGSITTDDPNLLQLFKQIRPNNTEAEHQALIESINDYEDGTIDTFDWTTRLIETLLLEFQPMEERHRTSSQCSNRDDFKHRMIRYFQRFRSFLKLIMHSRFVGISVLVLIVFHSILFAMMWYDINHTKTQLVIQSIRTSIVIIFVMEVIFRFIADGTFLLEILHLFDVAMVIIAAVGDILWYVIWFSYDSPELVPPLHVGWCVVASSVAVIGRLLVHSHMARTAVDILQSIYPVMFDLTLLVFAIIYWYAVIGNEIFQDKTTAESTARGYEGSYIAYGCGVGFESIGCSLLIVFQIITTNDWHEIMLGAMLDAGSVVSVIYFLSCYLMVDMVVMNLFVAISIEAYKKLARDMRNTAEVQTAAGSIDHLEENQQNEHANKTDIMNKAKQGASVAKSVLSEIFTPTKHSHSHQSNNTVISSSPYVGRRGTRGSLTVLGSKTSTPAIRRRSVITLSSDSDDSDNEKMKKTPETPRGRRPSITLTSITSIKPSLPTVRDEPENELPTPNNMQNRRKSALVARMAKRKKQKKKDSEKSLESIETNKQFTFSDIVYLNKRVRAVVSYAARSQTEMNVNEGQVVMVTAKVGEMYQGPDGKFPVTCVEDVPENNGSRSPSMLQRKVNFANNSPPTSTDRLSMSVPLPTLSHRNSQARMVKNTSNVEWRRKILGDMTVMNKAEMQELSKQFKGGLGRHHRVSSNNYSSHRPTIPIMEVEQIMEEEEDEVPMVTVSEPQFEVVSKVTDNTTKSVDTKKDTLTIPGSPMTSRRKSKEVPQWAKKFVEDKNIGLDVSTTKFDDVLPQPASSDDDDSSIKLMVHRSNSSSSSVPTVEVTDEEKKADAKK